MAEVPTHKHQFATSRSVTLYETSFAVMGPKLWNTLPKSIKLPLELQTFKDNLASFLLKITDTPPTIGYVAQNQNSILDWATTDSRMC